VLSKALKAAALQEHCRLQILVFDQQSSEQVRSLCATLSNDNHRFEWISTPISGLSIVRNEGLKRAISEIVLYLDADAEPEPGWAHALCRELEQPGVAIAGSRVLPRWETKEYFLARATRILSYYSVFDFGTESFDTGWVVGASFAVHKGRLGSLATFSEELGRIPGSLRSGEELELCQRVRAAGFQVRYVGSVAVHHNISNSRCGFPWLARRIFAAGSQRAVLGTIEGTPALERNTYDLLFAPIYLPLYLAGYFTTRGLSKNGYVLGGSRNGR